MKKTIVIAVIGVLSGLLLAGAITFFVLPEKGNSILIQTITPSPVTFHIDGAVQNPGVYSTNKGIRLNDAIELAGGLLASADVSGVNLSSKVNDEEKIFIPVIGQSAPVLNESSSTGSSLTKININTATIDELCELPGIGESKASDIVKYREENGYFLNLMDLLNVPGIGPSIFDKIESSITIE
jgi:competence protein ComEA